MMSKDKDNSPSVTIPILKPLTGPGQFANLHLKLNLEKSVYDNYRVNIVIYNIYLIYTFNK